MRTTPLAFTCLLCAVQLHAAPPTEITTTLGKTYTSVKITAVDPDGLRIMHSSGAAKVKFDDLSPEMQKQYGYDPVKAQQFLNQQAAAEAQRLQQIEQAKLNAKAEMQARVEAEQKSAIETFSPISAQDVRSAWLRSLSVPPSSLDRDYHDKVKRNDTLKTAIAAGMLDDQAKLTAIEYNANKLRALGRIDEANAFQAQSVALEKAIAQKAEAAAMQANADALNNLVDLLRN